MAVAGAARAAGAVGAAGVAGVASPAGVAGAVRVAVAAADEVGVAGAWGGGAEGVGARGGGAGRVAAKRCSARAWGATFRPRPSLREHEEVAVWRACVGATFRPQRARRDHEEVAVWRACGDCDLAAVSNVRARGAVGRASRGSCFTLLSEGRGETLSAKSCRCDLSAERCASSRESKGVSANAGEQVGQELREPER